MIDPRYIVYGVRGVAAIPLVEEHARTALNTIASRNSAFRRSSLVPSTTLDGLSPTEDLGTVAASDRSGDQNATAPRVQFSSNEQVRFLTPLDSILHDPDETTLLKVPDPSSPRSSKLSDQSNYSEQSVSTSTVAKALASRQSFWSRLSTRTSYPTSQTKDKCDSIPEPHSLLEEQEVVNKILEAENEEPATLVDSILSATAPPPASVEEKESELERKIVRECIREYSKGGMYFAYNFGKSTNSTTLLAT